MNTEWIYPGLISLTSVPCGYPMMGMMMHGSDEEKPPDERPRAAGTQADGETAGAQHVPTNSN
jgi:hypothetical protein